MGRWRWVFIEVAAVGLLAGCAKGVVESDVVSTCRDNAKSVETAAEAYHAQVGTWPPSLDALTKHAVVNGTTYGPWLEKVPSVSHFTIFVDVRSGSVFVYPPRTAQPKSLDDANRLDSGDPCASNAT
jgi:hypothetical protein